MLCHVTNFESLVASYPRQVNLISFKFFPITQQCTGYLLSSRFGMLVEGVSSDEASSGARGAPAPPTAAGPVEFLVLFF